MQFSILLALAPALAVVSALPNPDGYGPTTTSCVPKTMYTTSVGHSESCSTYYSSGYKTSTVYQTKTYTKTSEIPKPYVVTETSYVTTSGACPYTTKTPYYVTSVVTSYKESVGTSYTPSTITNYKPITKTSIEYKPYESCVTSASVGSSAYSIPVTSTYTKYWTSVYPTATSTCAAPGYGYGGY